MVLELETLLPMTSRFFAAALRDLTVLAGFILSLSNDAYMTCLIFDQSSVPALVFTVRPEVPLETPSTLLIKAATR